jgi:hypothetical protein
MTDLVLLEYGFIGNVLCGVPRSISQVLAVLKMSEQHFPEAEH